MKSSRLEAIKSIVFREIVQNQDELQKILERQGFAVTQATLSRDLRELGIVKTHDAESGVYRYQDVRSGKVFSIDPHHNRYTVETIKSVEFSGNQGIVKTYPGFAAAVASVIDDNVHSGIMGTIAGDDVVLIILRNQTSIPDLVREISLYISGFDTKVIENS
ncbi:MAG: ArgR family transcriptional regulator [Bacteroidales bacterium]|nr:ArgR family transcriptional regulator [Bacteroidales bacterium]